MDKGDRLKTCSRRSSRVRIPYPALIVKVLKMEVNDKYIKLNKARETNFLKTSRPEMWVFVLIPYFIGVSISGNFNLLIFLLFTLPYNYFVYKFDDILEDRYGKGVYEIVTAPVYYIFPLLIGLGSINLMIIIGLYFWMFGVNCVHTIGHKEMENKWGYVALPAILIGAYILQIDFAVYTFLVATVVVSFTHVALLITKTWRDDYWMMMFGFYLGVGIYEGVRFTMNSALFT